MNFELKRWKEKYTQELHCAADDADIAKWMDDSFPCPFEESDAVSYITARLCADDELEYSRAIIIDDMVCGGIHLARNNGIFSHSAQLTFWLAPQWQGQGVMTDALREFTAQVYNMYDVTRICALPFADNTAARRVLNSCGFELEGIMKNAAVKNGCMHDVCVYAALR